MPKKKKSRTQSKKNWWDEKTTKETEPQQYAKVLKLFLDNLKLFSLPEIAVYLLISRETTGRHLKSNPFSSRFTAEETNIDKDTAQKALKSLELKGWIKSVGVGPRRTRLYKVVLIESLSELKPIKELPKLKDLPSKQAKLDNLSASDCPTEWDSQRQNDCPTQWDNKGVPLSHSVGQSEIFTYLNNKKEQQQQETLSSFSISKKIKTTQELNIGKNSLGQEISKTTMLSSSFLEIPKKIKDAFPKKFSIDAFYKFAVEALSGSNGIPQRDEEYVLDAVEWLTHYTKTHYVTNPIGLFRAGLMNDNYVNEFRALRSIGIEDVNDPQAITQKKLEEARKEAERRSAEERATEQQIDSDNQIQESIHKLAPEEFEELKAKAIASMNTIQKRLFNKPKTSKSTLEKCMISVFKKQLKEKGRETAHV